MAIPVFEVGPVDQNVIYAFAAGFLLAWIIFGIRILVLKSRAKREIKGLRTNFVNRIDLEASSISALKNELEELKNKNANLKTSMHNLSDKPGRREKLQLQVYQTAIEKMSVRAPGFAPAWHIVLQECEQEAGRSLDGTIPFIRRIIPSVGTGWADNPVSITDDSSADSSSGAAIVSDSELSGTSGKKKSFISKFINRRK